MFKIINGNMLEELDKMEENSVGSIVTDPPYEINFMNNGWDNAGVAFSAETWRKCLRVIKPGGYLLSFAAARTQHRIACAIEDAGFEIRDTIMWLQSNGFPKSMDVSKMLQNSENVDSDLKKELSEKFNGFGYNLKPAYEPVIVARKPTKTSVVDNIVDFGVGVLNIDECRIPYEDTANAATNPLYRKNNGYKINHGTDKNSTSYVLKREDGEMNINPLGRFPSNVIMSMCCSDDDFIKTKLGESCRFFYCAKASKRDRDEGLDDLETKQSVGGGGGIGDYLDDVNSCSGKFGSEKAPHKNFHPTCKPTSLMQYLVRLVTPKGETILYPFMGSGSTGKAVAYENNDRNADYSFIGIELNPEYCDIAQRRIEFAEKDKTHLTESKQKKSKPNETVKKQSKLF